MIEYKKRVKGRVSMEAAVRWYQNNPADLIWWKDTPESVGIWIFSFDKKIEFNMFRDYPHALTPEQKKIFDDENPEWADFFKDRT